MTATLVEPSRVEEWVERFHEFDRADMPGAGWSFPVDESGNRTNRNPASDANYADALKGVADGTVIDHGIRAQHHRYRNPAVYRCRCGQTFPGSGDHQCACGRWYNASGQELDPHAMECPTYAAGYDCMCGERD